MLSLQDAQALLRRHRQEHLLAFHDRLNPAGRRDLLQQIASIDFDLLERLIPSHVLSAPQVRLPDDIAPPETLPAVPPPHQVRRYRAARARGRELVAAGAVAALVVAGGQGTRLGIQGPKGCLLATPVKGKSLFQLFAEQLLAARRRYGGPVPLYVMTSAANHARTRAFFREHGSFGLPADDVCVFQQGQMPALALDGTILLSEPGRIAFSPDGHGGCLTALRRSGALDDMVRRGVQLISYFQVDNPLVRCVDPLFLGLHAQAHAEMSAKAVPKRDPMEPLGNFCLLDGRVAVIEYSDLPEPLAQATRPDGTLRFPAGSIAIHVLSRSFVERLTAGGTCQLPFHRALKKVSHVDASGATVHPPAPNAVKLEQFIFDALPLAERTVVLQTFRSEEFSPIKNSAGADSLDTSRHDQVRRAAEWLESAGVRVPRDATGEVAAAIEISPLRALDAEQLAEDLPSDLSIRPGQELYLA